jgi:hypothetical protein
VPEPTQKYELSHLRPCKKVDISWDGLQFLCISLCRSLPKSMTYPVSDHAEKIILAEMVFNFYALVCAGAYSKVWVIPSQTMQKNWYQLRHSSISVHYLVPEPTKKYQLSISEHAEQLILAETVFNFYALACAGVYSKVWVIPSQTTQKNWY